MLLFKGLRLKQHIEHFHIRIENLESLKVVYISEHYYIKDIKKIYDIHLLKFNINHKSVKHVANDVKYYMLISKAQTVINYKYDTNL